MVSYQIAVLLTIGALSNAYTFVAKPSHQRKVFSPKLRKPINFKSSNNLIMRLHKSSRSRGGDSVLAQKNFDRVSKAGRRGSRNFVDPNKVFVGNLPYDATEKEVLAFFKEHLGNTRNIHRFKIIRDYKTGKSKGYGFAMFTDPMFATCAMEFCKGKKLKGRYVNLHQGKKKDDQNFLIVEKKKKKPIDAEEEIIQSGIDDAGTPTLADFDDISDEELFDEDHETLFDEEEYDGKMVELKREPLTEEELKMNRENRRNAQRRKKRRKLPHKGFQG